MATEVEGPDDHPAPPSTVATGSVDHRLHEAGEWMRALFDQAPIGVAVVSLDGVILAANDALCAFLDRPREGVVGETTLAVTHPDDVADDLLYGRSALEGEQHDALLKRFVRPDGTIVWGELTVTIVRDPAGAPESLIGQIVDVTATIDQQDALRRAREAEAAAIEHLAHLDRAKSNFLTAVSHELRTPLTVVRGMASTLHNRGDDLDEPTRRKFASAIHSNADRLSQLLDDLLDVDRVTRLGHDITRQRFDVVDLVASAIRTSPIAGRITLDAPTSLVVDADPIEIERIVVNLTTNAEKYAPLGEVHVVVTARPDGGFRLQVLDEGPGIPAGELERVFEPFHRIDTRAPRPGTGVGLTLVAEFTRLHGGRAWAVPRDNGAHFVVDIPGQPLPQTSAKARGAQWEAGSGADGHRAGH
jgi:two-component system, sensor histidine kinase and response regulator